MPKRVIIAGAAGFIGRALGQVLGRPAWTVVPALVLRLVFGPMADETLLTSPKALRRRLLEASFTFRYPRLQAALEATMRGGES